MMDDYFQNYKKFKGKIEEEKWYIVGNESPRHLDEFEAAGPFPTEKVAKDWLRTERKNANNDYAFRAADFEVKKGSTFKNQYFENKEPPHMKLIQELLGLNPVTEGRTPGDGRMDMNELIEKYTDQEKMYHFEGSRGVSNFDKLIGVIGYRNMDEFLEDNPGCIQAMIEWLGDQRNKEWEESLKAELADVVKESSQKDLPGINVSNKELLKMEPVKAWKIIKPIVLAAYDKLGSSGFDDDFLEKGSVENWLHSDTTTSAIYDNGTVYFLFVDEGYDDQYDTSMWFVVDGNKVDYAMGDKQIPPHLSNDCIDVEICTLGNHLFDKNKTITEKLRKAKPEPAMQG